MNKRMMHKWGSFAHVGGWVMLCLLALALLVAGCAAPATPSPEPTTAPAAPTPVPSTPEMGPPIILGFDGVLSGPNALNGELSSGGAILAVEEINAAGGVNVPGEGTRPFELIIEDDQGSPDVAVSAVSKLVFEDEAFAILGPDFGNIVVATLQLCREHGFLQIYSTISSATRKPEIYCDTSFRNRSEDTYWARALVDYMVEELGFDHIATSYQNFEFGITGNDMVVERLADHGLEPVVTVTHEIGDTDLTAQAATIVAADVEAVINWGLQAQQALLLQELRNFGWEGVLATPVPDAVFINVAGELANGVIGPQNWVYSAPDPQGQAFTASYQERFDMLPDSHSAGYYDAVYLLKYAIENVGLDTEAVAEFLANLEEWEGLQGTFRPAELDQAQLTSVVSIVRIENLEPVVVKIYE